MFSRLRGPAVGFSNASNALRSTPGPFGVRNKKRRPNRPAPPFPLTKNVRAAVVASAADGRASCPCNPLISLAFPAYPTLSRPVSIFTALLTLTVFLYTWAASRSVEELDVVVGNHVQAKKQYDTWTEEDEAGYQIYLQEQDMEKRTYRAWYLIANPRKLPKEIVNQELAFRFKLFPDKMDKKK